MSWQVLRGDCIESMRGMDEASVDAVVCDPPYGLEFMGKEWDRLGASASHRQDRAGEMDMRVMQEWHEAWATEALRVLRPGGHLLAFGGTRTYHRLACAIEDAGFEIRDCLAWLYGSGFPKSHNLSGEWQGWGTALKPAHEPIVLARKPLTGTVAGNVLAHGTGALNVDGCRVAGPKGDGNWKGKTDRKRGDDFAGFEGGWNDDEPGEQNAGGRWPANVILDPEAARLLDEQSGERGASGKASGPTLTGESTSNSRGKFNGVEDTPFYGDTGGASRFFYCAKASRAERNAGLEGFEERDHGERSAQNVHPTVKPIALMRWLCRLVTPPGGTILDPFTGSGTTGAAAVLEGFDFIGCEREAEYVRIAEARIAYWNAQPVQIDLFGDAA